MLIKSSISRLASCLLLALPTLCGAAPAESVVFDFRQAIESHIDSSSRYAEPLIKRVDSKTRGAWSQQGELAVWTYSIHVPGAVSLGFYADDAYLPPSATVEVRTDKDEVIYGASRFRSGTMLTSPLKGSRLAVTVRMPASGKAKARFSIDRFNVGYRSLVNGVPDHPLLAGLKAAYLSKTASENTYAAATNPYTEADKNSACDRNFVCERSNKPTIADPGQAIVGLTVFGVDFCTANLVMDAGGSFTTFLATAAHCISYGDALPPNSDGYIIRWSQETPCGSDLQFVSNDPSKETTGAVIRSMYQDALLLEATDPPPYGANPYWAGWTAEELTNFKNYKPYDPAANTRDYTAEACDPKSPYYKPTAAYCDGIQEQAIYGIHHGRTRTKQYVETGTTANSSADGSKTFTNQQQMPSYKGADGANKSGPIYQAWILKLSPVLKTGRIAGGASGSAIWFADKKKNHGHPVDL